ncbi:MAG: 1-acyl-sn-glycerol-3-phosphate acyltransferase [Clostridia bacterium]|nr:1-acyl-sn-glycerol-3-phosphate acyltransferase [Clostridia bacterium]
MRYVLMNNQNLSPGRIKILEKIKSFEKQGLWNKDTEDDPEAPVLMPDKIDYLNKKLINKFSNKFANYIAIKFYDKEIKKGNLIIKNVVGLENYDSVKGGAIITCNHFNIYDNYVMFKALQKRLGKKNLYKVIREGNYTNFPGFFGYLFKHCNTLPLSSNFETMKKFMKAVETLLKRGDKILIYPEQALWWNYKKPRPLKPGAFNLSAINFVPVIPCFITMIDSDKVAPDGSFFQEYTLHIMPPIFPDKNKSVKENSKDICEKNYQLWKEKYEEVYKIPLTYLTENND